ncbi:lipopolysaccharide heptosyltransferase II [bacterium]|nr:lipopolysaccharide heptosyltransferase II [bacterium]
MIGKILVRVPNWIGDVVMSTAGLAVLKQACPMARISVVAKPWVSDVLKYHPAIDEIVIHNPGKFPERVIDFFLSVKKLKGMACDTGVLFHKNFESALMFFAAGIPERIGRPSDGRGFLLTSKVKLSNELLLGHQVGHYLAIAEQTTGMSMDDAKPEVHISDLERIEARNYLSEIGVSGRIIPISAGAAYGTAKCWPSDRIVQFLKEASLRFKAVVVFLGGEAERKTTEKIIVEAEVKAYSMAGKFSLLTQAALVERAGMCISNDSGLMHVSAAVSKVRVIALFGPTIPRETGPYGEGHIVIHKPPECWPCKHRTCPSDHSCMRDISVEDVLNAVESVLV